MLSVKNKSLIHFHFINIIFGFSSILGVLISIQAIPLVWYRMLIASASLGVFFLVFQRSHFLLARRKALLSVLFGGVIIALHWITFFHAIKIVGVSLTLSMMSTGAFMTSIIEPLAFRRRFSFRELLFGAMALIGVAVIFNAELASSQGIFIALFSAFLSALFSVLNGKMVQNHKPVTLTFYQLLIGTLCISLYLIAFMHYGAADFAVTSMDIVWLLILGIICTAYAFYAFIAVMKNLSPFTIMMLINMEPIYGILLALSIFGEKEYLSANFYLGLIIVLLAIATNGFLKWIFLKKNKKSRY